MWEALDPLLLSNVFLSHKLKSKLIVSKFAISAILFISFASFINAQPDGGSTGNVANENELRLVGAVDRLPDDEQKVVLSTSLSSNDGQLSALLTTNHLTKI